MLCGLDPISQVSPKATVEVWVISLSVCFWSLGDHFHRHSAKVAEGLRTNLRFDVMKPQNFCPDALTLQSTIMA